MQTSGSPGMRATEWALLVGLSVLWGGSFFFAKVALAEVPPLTVLIARVVVAAAALWSIVLLVGIPVPTDARRWLDFAIMGVVNNVVPFALLFWGQTQIASGLASILNATTPLFGVVLAHFATSDERLTRRRSAGVVAGFSGVTVMIGPAAFADFGADALAQSACLAAAFSYAVASLFGRRFRGVAPMVTAAGQLTCSAIIALPVAALVDHPWSLPPPGWHTWSSLAALALLSTALAYVIYFRLLSTAGATNLLLVTFLIPISASTLGALVLDERLGVRHFAGMALIGVGLAMIDGRLTRALGARVGAIRRGPGKWPNSGRIR